MVTENTPGVTVAHLQVEAQSGSCSCSDTKAVATSLLAGKQIDAAELACQVKP